MVGSRHLGKTSIIVVECVGLRDDVVAAMYNGFSNLEIEGGLQSNHRLL